MSKFLDKAFSYGAAKHKGIQDDAGKPYFDHCIQVHDILKMVTQNEDILCAALLHDTLEDTDTSYADLVKVFNTQVANLVREVTKEGYNYFPRLESKEATLIKFADRLSNLSRMEVWGIEKQKQYLKKSKFWKT